MISRLKKEFGPKCLGLKVNYTGENIYTSSKTVRFCEAVNDAFRTPLLLNPQNLSCLGGLRSMSLVRDDKMMTKYLAEEYEISFQVAKKVLVEIPTLNIPIHNVLLGINEEMEKTITPDLYIIYLTPGQLTKLSSAYISRTHEFPMANTFPYLSVCGNIFLKTFRSAQMNIAIGCSQSRQYGEIKDNQLVVGLPYNKSVQIFNTKPTENA